jgi:hypothetical protein
MSALRTLASCSRPACVRCVPYSTRAVLKAQTRTRPWSHVGITYGAEKRVRYWALGVSAAASMDQEGST